MMKTERLVSLPLPEPAQKIASRWIDRHDRPFVFPFLEEGETTEYDRLRRRINSNNTIVNGHLKSVARKADIRSPDEVTFHVARHSFADFARRRSSDLYAVSKALGHSDLDTTEEYLAGFDQDAVDNLLNNEVWTDDNR
jgi:integrase